MIRVTLLIVLFFVGSKSIAQSQEAWLQHLIETAEKFSDNPIDYNELENSLRYFAEHKISLNKAGKEMLMQIPLMTSSLADSILLHRLKYGNFRSIFELQAVGGINAEDIIWLKEICDVLPSTNSSVPGKPGNHNHRLLWSYACTYSASPNWQFPSAYLGSNRYLRVKYRGQLYKSWNLGFCSETDIGEPFGRTGDFHSFYLQYQGQSILKKLIIGDYVLNLAYGLNRGATSLSQLSFFSPQIPWIRKGITAHGSGAESGFNRGVAASFSLNKISADMWYSCNAISAKTQVDSVNYFPVYISVDRDGLHRTVAEIAGKNSALEVNHGFTVKYRNSFSQTGIIINQQAVFPPSELAVTTLNKKPILGFFAEGKYQQWIWGAEFSNYNASSAFILQQLVSLHKYYSFQCIYRHYDVNYSNDYNGAYRQLSGKGGEHGLLCIFRLEKPRGKSWYFSGDMYRMSSAAYLIHYPSHGQEWKVKQITTFSKESSLQLTARYNQIEKDLQEASLNVYAPVEIKVYQLKAEYLDKLSPQISCRLKCEGSRGFNRKRQWVEGLHIHVAITYIYNKQAATKLSGFISVFNIADPLNEVFLREPGIPELYSSLTLSGRGFRAGFTSQFKLGKHQVCYFKYTLMQKYEAINTVLETAPYLHTFSLQWLSSW